MNGTEEAEGVMERIESRWGNHGSVTINGVLRRIRQGMKAYSEHGGTSCECISLTCMTQDRGD